MPGILQERLKNKKENNYQEENVYQENLTGMRPPQIPSPEEILSDEDIAQLNHIDQMMSDENFALEGKKRKLRRRVSTFFLTAACTYLVILIYGSFITEFYYNDAGEIAPVVMTVSDISEKNEYNTIVGMYIQTRQLYERLLSLDYRMAAGAEDTLTIAPEYEKTLDTISSLTTQIDAAVINSKYNQVKNMLLTWVKTHAAAYCQYMSTAITQNDNNAAAEAIAARQVLNSNFQLITQNIVTLGNDIKGYELEEIKDWSPDRFIQETIEGFIPDDTKVSKDSSDVSTEAGIDEKDTASEPEITQSEESGQITKEFQSDFSLQ